MENTRSRDFILRLAIEKAVNNGYKLPYIVDLQLEMRNMEELVRYHQIDPANCMDDRWSVMSLNGIIFSHDFAKAFWPPKKERVNACTKCGYLKPYSKHDNKLFCPNDGRKLKEGEFVSKYDQEWQYHLQQMVLWEDPIIYLSEFV